ncbi:MAG: S9 family peptidase [Planctomycetota bacterium]|jgi:acylaminoacyl-peptidase
MTTLTAPRRTKPKVRARQRVTPEDLLKFHLVSDPQISPDASRIVFVKKHVGEKNEYVTNLWMADSAARAGWAAGSGGDAGSGESGEPRQFTNGGKDTHPRWSPKGDRIAFIGGRDKHKPQLYVIGARGGEAVALTKLPEGSIGTFRWSPDAKLIALTFRPQDSEWTEAAKKNRQEKGLSDPPRVLDHYWYRLDGDGYFNRQRYQLYLIDAVSGAHRVVYTKDTLGFFTFDFSPDCRQIVISTNRDRRAGLKGWHDELVRLDVANGKTTPIPDLPRGPKDAVRWSPDGKCVAYAGREGADAIYSTENLELWICDPVRGGAKCLTGHEDYCLMAAPMTDTAEVAFNPVFAWSPDGKRIYMQLGWRGESHLASVPRAGGRITFHTAGARVHSLGNISADGRAAAMTVGSPTRLDEIHVADLARDKVTTTALTDFNGPLLKERELPEPSSHWVKTPEGTKVHLWVLKPAGFRAGKRYPAILEIHGGPHAQYGVGFFHEFQVLAAAGYAVFYSNPRGSKGYGRDHCAAIRGSWGGADWADLQAVTAFMKSQPFVDPKRMGVMGGSYGGYMTNWVIGHTNEFVGAITDRCVSNLVSMFGSSDFLEPPDIYWPGNSWDRPEKLWEQSPLKYFGKAKTPTLIIHSEGDLRCNIEQAEQVFSALKLLNVPTRLVRYPRSSSHGLSRGGPPDLRLHRLEQILGWWKKYLGSGIESRLLRPPCQRRLRSGSVRRFILIGALRD